MARTTALLGVIPSVAWVIGSLMLRKQEGAFQLLLSAPCILFCFVLIVTGLTAGRGLFAHVWFHGTGFSVRRMAIALALLGDAAPFSWGLVFTH